MYSLKKYYINYYKKLHFYFYSLCNTIMEKIKTFDSDISYLDLCICNIHRVMRITAIQ